MTTKTPTKTSKKDEQVIEEPEFHLTEKQIEQEIIEVGKRTVIDLGIHGLHPELIKIVGRI